MVPSPIDYSNLDAARWMAALAVVVLHCAAVPITGGIDYGSGDWQWANLYDAATRWCVPVFVMISGALLLDPDKTQRLSHFYRRRAGRIVPATLFWSLFYLLWSALTAYFQGVPLASIDWVANAISGEPYYHLWYLYMLIGLYVITPFLRWIYRKITPRQRVITLCVLFALAMLQSVYREYQGNGYGFFLLWCLPYISYFWAGRMLVERQFRLPQAGLLLGISIFGTALGTQVLSSSTTLNLYFYDNFSVTVPFMSLAVFQLILSTRWLPRFENVAPYTFGIYLLHPFFLDLVTYSGLYGSGAMVWQIPTFALGIFSLSLGASWLLRRMPGGTTLS